MYVFVHICVCWPTYVRVHVARMNEGLAVLEIRFCHAHALSHLHVSINTFCGGRLWDIPSQFPEARPCNMRIGRAYGTHTTPCGIDVTTRNTYRT